ncbi:BtrH N-terminal domain-containing protein [Paenibacillus sp. N3/727]|uniref:BtrH N-terminal domain-containing protein n=1 Tax=Paenibacillus sp. N3/727 TaxID=2925845 RepID=UPI001F5337D3|nr:BtrH N-terminal domain-containing protein [Paenibacillus sp. N3/727]UNK18917.1 BtrH N-terminal domain-containing protein [Paenibacillus sp. N3/727]
MEKALPVTYPAIDAYNNIANVLSIIQGDHRVAEWLHSHFIQLYHDKSFEDGFTLSFYAPYLIKTCPWLDTQIVHKRIVEKGWDDITRFLIDCIDSGCYVILIVDQFYIPNSFYYQTSHRPHELFVYGYHLGNEEFYISDNFASGKYKRLACSFGDMRTAYTKLLPEMELNYNDYNGTMFVLSKKELAEPIPFHLQLVVHQLEDYLHAKDSSASDQTLYAHYKPNRSYGLQCYSNLIKYVGHVCDCQEYLDIRPFHVIYLHKKQMCSRIEFMQTKVDLLSGEDLKSHFSELEKTSLITRNLVMKYNFSNDPSLKTGIIDQLETIVSIEKLIVPQLIEQIKLGFKLEAGGEGYAVR